MRLYCHAITHRSEPAHFTPALDFFDFDIPRQDDDAHGHCASMLCWRLISPFRAAAQAAITLLIVAYTRPAPQNDLYVLI